MERGLRRLKKKVVEKESGKVVEGVEVVA